MKLERLQKDIGYRFCNQKLLSKALTHSSYAYENQPQTAKDNELLEFLGDSVVGLITAEFFYAAFPDKGEGELSKLKSSATSTFALARFALKIRLDKFVMLGRGEEKSGGRKKPSILAGTFEALAAAVFLDGGLEAARKFVTQFLTTTLAPIRSQGFEINNYKSALQEMFQKSNLPAPRYTTVTEKGPAHKKTFLVELLLDGRCIAKATGHSKKSAEQKAAQKALKTYLGRKMKELSPEAFIVEDRR